MKRTLKRIFLLMLLALAGLGIYSAIMYGSEMLDDIHLPSLTTEVTTTAQNTSDTTLSLTTQTSTATTTAVQI